jgi:hypothetical protein
MATQLEELFIHFGLCDKVVTYVKDKGANFRVVTVPICPSQHDKHIWMQTQPYVILVYG